MRAGSNDSAPLHEWVSGAFDRYLLEDRPDFRTYPMTGANACARWVCAEDPKIAEETLSLTGKDNNWQDFQDDANIAPQRA